MTFIRTNDQLEDRLDQELAWRRTEMHSMLASIRTARGIASECLCRGGVALLYAHWEGYTKRALQHYWDFVATKRLSYKELSVNFLALGVEREVKRQQNASATVMMISRAQRLMECSEDRALMSDRDLDTQSNLNSDVLTDLCEKLNLDVSVLVTKHKLIDESLLKSRNTIAHGEYMPVTREAYEELHFEVLGMLDQIRTIVSNAASTGRFYRVPRVIAAPIIQQTAAFTR